MNFRDFVEYMVGVALLVAAIAEYVDFGFTDYSMMFFVIGLYVCVTAYSHQQDAKFLTNKIREVEEELEDALIGGDDDER